MRLFFRPSNIAEAATSIFLNLLLPQNSKDSVCSKVKAFALDDQSKKNRMDDDDEGEEEE
jgi:hypothetical protein